MLGPFTVLDELWCMQWEGWEIHDYMTPPWSYGNSRRVEVLHTNLWMIITVLLKYLWHLSTLAPCSLWKHCYYNHWCDVDMKAMANNADTFQRWGMCGLGQSADLINWKLDPQLTCFLWDRLTGHVQCTTYIIMIVWDCEYCSAW